jgi:hypothetical protein
MLISTFRSNDRRFSFVLQIAYLLDRPSSLTTTQLLWSSIYLDLFLDTRTSQSTTYKLVFTTPNFEELTSLISVFS